MEKIKIIIVDDHLIVREGLKSLLENQNKIEIIGEASNGLESIHLVEQLSPDIVLMDISMPIMNGIEATKILHHSMPNSKILVLTMHTNKEYVHQILESGAKGYILKNSSSTELMLAIETVFNGGAFFSPGISNFILDEFSTKTERIERNSFGKDDLTSREREILAYIAMGWSSKKIAESLSLSTRTVDTHRERIMSKLDLHTIADITRYAIENNIIKTGSD
jgi:two-component system, NarL family, nitrate/nitrite response regulator NarL